MQKANIFSSEQINGNYQKNYQCLVNSDLEGNISDKQIYSELNMAEIYIGAVQFSAWRHFYKIELKKTAPGTTATLYSYKNMGSISEEKIWEKIHACAK